MELTAIIISPEINYSPPKPWIVPMKAPDTSTSVAKSIYSRCKAGGDTRSNGALFRR